MIRVVADPNEPIDVVIRKFNKKVQADGILTELKKREFYEKPSLARKRDQAARRRKMAKRGFEG
jgi:small subunit ribosomal protein S21